MLASTLPLLEPSGSGWHHLQPLQREPSILRNLPSLLSIGFEVHAHLIPNHRVGMLIKLSVPDVLLGKIM